MRKLLIGMLAISIPLGMASRPAHALCEQTWAAVSEEDLYNVHACDQEFIETTRNAASLRRGDWSGRGWDGANSCNILYEFPKFWNSWYLVTYGISPIPEPVPCPPGTIICLNDVIERPWHDNNDYLQLVRASNPGEMLIYHWDLRYYGPSDNIVDEYGVNAYGIYYVPGGSGTGVGAIDALADDFSSSVLGKNKDKRIVQSCAAYDKEPGGDPPALGATPAFRTGNFVHESWHAWDQGWDKLVSLKDAGGHEVLGTEFCPKNPGVCKGCTGKGCDHFRPHRHSDFQSGDLWQAGHSSGSPSLLSVYQVQLEYLCDLADNGETWVPYSVREDAANGAGRMARNHFVERVPYWCGSTRPLWGGRPGGSGRVQHCTDQNRTSCVTGCRPNGTCGNDGCCIFPCASGMSCSANYTCSASNYSCDVATGCCYYNVIK